MYRTPHYFIFTIHALYDNTSGFRITILNIAYFNYIQDDICDGLIIGVLWLLFDRVSTDLL